MISLTQWKKILQYQEKPGWCGPAVLHMALAACAIDKTQSEIADAVYDDSWGTAHEKMVSYLRQFFPDVEASQNNSVKNIQTLLKKGHIVIVNWWDDMDESEPDGHYSIVIGYRQQKHECVLLDPSRARSGIWAIGETDFQNRWWDYTDISRRNKMSGWLAAVLPSPGNILP